MSSNSSIEWTNATWVVTTGCTEKSSGCAHCYARGMSKRLGAMASADIAKGKNPGKKADYVGAVDDRGRWTGMVVPVESALAEPLGWRQPRMIFVNSMSDLFWGDADDLADARRRGVADPQPVPAEFIAEVFAVMWTAQWHTFQVLTKRPKRMAILLSCPSFWEAVVAAAWRRFVATEPDKAAIMSIDDLRADIRQGPLRNVWIGCSVEDQPTADERIPHLLRCPAAVRFLSCEPMLGPVDLDRWVFNRRSAIRAAMRGPAALNEEQADSVVAEVGIHWCIVGGESGPGARPMHPDWARSVRDQCAAAGVAYFFKQWGEYMPLDDWRRLPPDFDGPTFETMPKDRIRLVPPYDAGDDRAGLHVQMARVGKHYAGRLLDGVEHNAMPSQAEAGE